MNISNLTNQELLKELEQRIPNFNQDEMIRTLELILFNLPRSYQEKIMSLNPQETSDIVKKSIREVAQDKREKEQVELIKKFFEKKKQ